jgi:hypothetical protein
MMVPVVRTVLFHARKCQRDRKQQGGRAILVIIRPDMSYTKSSFMVHVCAVNSLNKIALGLCYKHEAQAYICVLAAEIAQSKLNIKIQTFN